MLKLWWCQAAQHTGLQSFSLAVSFFLTINKRLMGLDLELRRLLVERTSRWAGRLRVKSLNTSVRMIQGVGPVCTLRKEGCSAPMPPCRTTISVHVALISSSNGQTASVSAVDHPLSATTWSAALRMVESLFSALLALWSRTTLSGLLM